jgi:hypothetical protein
MKSGYIALHRKIQDNFLWREKRVFSKAEAWIDLLMETRWKTEPKEFVIKNKRLVCNYGECLYSLETWARRWGWNKTKVRRVLDLFQKCSMIEYKNETVSVRIRICNYEKYDITRNQNDLKVKRKRNGSETESAPTEQGITRNNKEGLKPPYPPWLNIDLWNEFREFRKSLKAPLTPGGESRLIKTLGNLIQAGGNQDAIIGQSIERGWKGLFQCDAADRPGKRDPYDEPWMRDVEAKPYGTA